MTTATTNVTTITLNDPTYPHLLTILPKYDRPKQLHMEGNTALLGTKCVGFTGSQHTTPKGQNVAFKIAAHFAAQGYTIVSGMCPGTDIAAHKGALSVGGNTIAVLGSSLDRKDFRRRTKDSLVDSRAIAQEILEGGGLLISEYAQGPATGERYFRRNGILAGLSLGIFVIQCEGTRSGTMATVRRATRYGRRVYVPQPLKGEADNAQYKGIWSLVEEREPDTDSQVFQGKQDYPEILDDLEGLAAICHTWTK